MIQIIKKFFKDTWTWIWSKTEIDEKVVAGAKEVKKRAKAVKEEIKDVGKAIKEVGNQVGDVGDAIKGKSRKGRKPKVKMPKPVNMGKMSGTPTKEDPYYANSDELNK
tara:strand:+ start:521 stop:844 length:324 start_codon:yes stop_codon:yes gene_type:complete